MRRLFWRSVPVGTAVAALLVGAAYVSSRPAIESYHVGFLMASLVWVVVALSVAGSRAHRQLGAVLRDLRPGRFVAIATALLTLAVVVFLNRRTLPVGVVPLVLAVMHGTASSSSPRRQLVKIFVATALTAALLEVSLLALGEVPVAVTRPLRQVLYINQWNMIQADTACSRYDRELGYTLRPGECRFANREFDTRIRVNRLGLRDDEASLERPEVIVLGDSYAMGWGVAGEATFASLLERWTGHRVLNAAISSYGTAREVSLLRRIDLGAVHTLIVQYHPNDLFENIEFVENDLRLPPRDSSWFASLVQAGKALRSYYPGKAMVLTWRDLFTHPVAALLSGRLEKVDPRGPSRSREAALLSDVLMAARDLLPDARVIIVELDNWQRPFLALEETGSPFVRELRDVLAADPRSRDMRVVDAQPVLDAGDFFELDMHTTAAGHEKIARLLHEEICRAARGGQPRESIGGCGL